MNRIFIAHLTCSEFKVKTSKAFLEHFWNLNINHYIRSYCWTSGFNIHILQEKGESSDQRLTLCVQCSECHHFHLHLEHIMEGVECRCRKYGNYLIFNFGSSSLNHTFEYFFSQIVERILYQVKAWWRIYL